METLEEVEKAIKSGIQIFKNGKKLKQEQNEKERQGMAKLNASLNQYTEELLNLIDGNEITAQAMGETRRIGGK